jgi:hypothetical protein
MVEPSRIKVMLVTDDGGAITLVASERGLAPVVARLREQGWRLVDADDSAAPGRFPVAPTPLRRVEDVPVGQRRSVA